MERPYAQWAMQVTFNYNRVLHLPADISMGLLLLLLLLGCRDPRVCPGCLGYAMGDEPSAVTSVCRDLLHIGKLSGVVKSHPFTTQCYICQLTSACCCCCCCCVQGPAGVSWLPGLCHG
jgi:hypothetical protein